MEKSSVLSLDRDVEKGEPPLKKSVKEFLDGLVNLNFSNKILAIVLFGSQARGEAKITSDIDLAVFSASPLARTEVAELHLVIDESFPDVKYSLFFTCPNNLETEDIFNANYHIKREGVIIYGK